MWIRTTTGSEDCLVKCTAFNPMEEGAVAVGINDLKPAAFDSGGFVDLSMSRNRLVIDYGDLEQGSPKWKLITSDVTEADYPVLLDTEETIFLPTEYLKRALGHIQPIEKTGHPLKSCVHLIPEGGEQFYIMGTDGQVGFIDLADGGLRNVVSIGQGELPRALQVVGGGARLGMVENRVVVSDDRARVSFSFTASQSPAKLVDGFFMETDGGEFNISLAGWLHVVEICARSTAVFEETQALFTTADGKLNVKIIGGGVDVKTTVRLVGQGEIIPSVFYAKEIVRIGSFTQEGAENTPLLVKAHKMEGDATSRFWYIVGKGRQLLYSCTPIAFAADLEVTE